MTQPMSKSGTTIWRPKGVYAVGLFLMVVSSVLPWIVCSFATRFSFDLVVIASLGSFAGVASAFFILVEGVQTANVRIRVITLGLPLAYCLAQSVVVGLVIVQGGAV